MENQTNTTELANAPVMTKQELMARLKVILDNSTIPLKDWLDVFDRYCQLAEYL